MLARMSSLDLDWVRVPVEAAESGNAVDPTSLTVEMAFMPVGEPPEAGDWQEAQWDVDHDIYLAECLVGPGGTVDPGAGEWRVWVRVLESVEIPVKESGTLVIE